MTSNAAAQHLALFGSRETEWPVGEIRIWRGCIIARLPDRELLNYANEPTGYWLRQYVTIPMMPQRPWGHTNPGSARIGISVHLAHTQKYGHDCPHRIGRLGEMVRTS